MTKKQRGHTRMTVATIIKCSNKYLMVEERTQNQGLVINQLAGHMDQSKGIVDAAIREILKETCWLIGIDHIIFIYQWSMRSKKILSLSTKTYVRFTFASEAIEGQSDQIQLGTDIFSTHWSTLAEIVNNFTTKSSLVIRSILNYEANQQAPLNIYQNLDLAGI